MIIIITAVAIFYFPFIVWWVLDASSVHSKLQTSEVIISPVFLSSSTPRVRPELAETKQMAVHRPRWQPIGADGNLKGTNLKIHTVRESTAVSRARLYTRQAVASLYCWLLCFCSHRAAQTQKKTWRFVTVNLKQNESNTIFWLGKEKFTGMFLNKLPVF